MKTTSFSIDLNSLTEHALITGPTGVGKTNDVFFILKELWQQKIPFLVIEPAKTEYRKLRNVLDMRTFTLGNETIAPFRLNPFEVPEGVYLQTHIDHLKSIFTASFNWFGPTPYVLEQCLHKVYTDKGWNLVTGKNRRGLHPSAYPTLTDLYNVVDDVVNKLAYKPETTMEIKAALKVRINNLREGSKGLMLDTPISFPIDELLRCPTVLELEYMGKDDEKAFVIGLLLMCLYEYYTTKGVQEATPLRHLTVIEEAHRLLQNVPMTENPEVASVRRNAIETFAHILSEIRAYGEGFVIVEQIPSKLLPDVVKNTGLKITHRTTSAEEIALMAGVMNLNERQQRYLFSLEKGQAAVFSAGDDRSTITKFPYSKNVASPQTKMEEETEIANMMNFIAKRYPQIYQVGHPNVPYSVNSMAISKEGQKLAEDDKFKEHLAQYILSIVLDESSLFPAFSKVEQTINSLLLKATTDYQPLFYSVLTHGASNYFDGIGQEYTLTFESIEKLKNTLLEILGNVIFAKRDLKVPSPDPNTKSLLHEFQKHYKAALQIAHYPYTNCKQVCPTKLCLYRYNVRPFLEDRRLDKNFRNALENVSSNEPWNKLKETCQVIPRRVLAETARKSQPEIQAAACFAIQKSQSDAKLDYFLENKIITNLINVIAA